MDHSSRNYNQQPTSLTAAYQENLHLCRFCGPESLSYSSPATLEEHISLQHTAPTIRCIICGPGSYDYSSPASVNQHIKKKHRDHPDARTQGDAYECSICGSLHCTRESLKDHKLKEHKPTCESCGKSFYNRSTLVQHVKDNVCGRSRHDRDVLNSRIRDFNSEPSDRNQAHSFESFNFAEPSSSFDLEPERSQQYPSSERSSRVKPSGSNQQTEPDDHMSDEKFDSYLNSYSDPHESGLDSESFDWNHSFQPAAPSRLKRLPSTEHYALHDDY